MPAGPIRPVERVRMPDRTDRTGRGSLQPPASRRRNPAPIHLASPTWAHVDRRSQGTKVIARAPLRPNWKRRIRKRLTTEYRYIADQVILLQPISSPILFPKGISFS